jgi:hypothetical protein
MILPPNNWAPTKDTFWPVTANQAIDLWGILQINDAIGLRPYVPASGASLSAVFQRGDFIGSVTSQNLTVTKTASLDPNFRALAKISLTAAEASNVTSGTIVFTLTEGTAVQQWTANWSIKKLNCSAGF